MVIKNWIIVAGLCSWFVAPVMRAESFIEEPCVTKKKKLSSKQKKEKIADDLKEYARNITQEMKELLEIQESIIDRLDELVNNDKNGVFSGASDVSLTKAVDEIEKLRSKSAQRRNKYKEQNNFLKQGYSRGRL